ncbi:unnamed protein product [Alternaria burnsii]|nr:unnamed protein product [Alternaria burnsii]
MFQSTGSYEGSTAKSSVTAGEAGKWLLPSAHMLDSMAQQVLSIFCVEHCPRLDDFPVNVQGVVIQFFQLRWHED